MRKSSIFLVTRGSEVLWLCCLIMFVLLVGKVFSATPDFLKPVRQFRATKSVTAMAVTADEALVAVAMKDNGDALVEIRDLVTGKVLQQFTSPDNPALELEFDFRQRLLALGGRKRIELWDLESSKPRDETRLSNRSRIWQHATEQSGKLSFSRKSAKLRWIEGHELNEIPLKSPFIENPVWTGEGGRLLKNFNFDPYERILALAEHDHNEIRLLQPWQKIMLPSLDYHHFPVVDMLFLDSNRLISLDQEQNLAWGEIRTRIKTSPPRNDTETSAGRAVRLFRIFKDQVLIFSTEKPYRARVMDRSGTEYHSLPLVSSGALTVSPTGKYVLTADADNRVQLHRSILHQSPQEYMKQLLHSGAENTARRFQNQLPEPLLETQEPGWSPEKTTLNILEESLTVAEKTQHWAETDRLAREILALNPNNHKAVLALKHLRSRKDELVLEQGHHLLEQQDYDQAITLLKQILPASPLHRKARSMIALADRSAQTSLSLKNAEEQLRMGNWEGATIILQQILDEEPQNKLAANLLKEAKWSGFWSSVENILYFLLALFLFLALVWWAYQRREQFGETFLSPNKESVTLKTFPNINLKENISAFISPEEKRFLETLKKTQEFLTLAQKRDVTGENAARLLDFEAEIKIIADKAEKSEATFKHLNTQLVVLLQTLRGMKFKGSSQQKQKRKAEKSSSKSTENYYELLGVTSNASDAEIKKAYHRKIKEYHPDRHENTEFDWVREQAATMSRNLREAYEVLIDQKSRKLYDANLK